MSSQDKAINPDVSSGGATVDSASGSVSLSESTPSILQHSEANTATDSTSHSPNQNAIDADGSKGSEATSIDGHDADDIQARIEKKRLEHEQQRALQRKAFEQQMALLEKQQREEEQTLLQQRQPGVKPGQNANATAVASAPTTPPNEISPTAAAGPGVGAGGRKANVGPVDALTSDSTNVASMAHLYRSMPSSRRQSRDGYSNAANGGADELSESMAGMSIETRGSSQSTGATSKGNTRSLLSQAVHNDAAGANAGAAAAGRGAGQHGEGFTPVFSERFLFDDELDNEDSAFVKKYNLQGDDDKFPILVRRDSFSDVLSAQSAALDRAPISQAKKASDAAAAQVKNPRVSEWPNFGGPNSDAALAAAAAAANRKPELTGDLSSSSMRAASSTTSPQPHNVSNIGHGFAASAGRPGNFPLPSPSPRLSQTGGRSSPAVSGTPFANRQASGPVSPSPGISGLADAPRPTGGSRFVNTSALLQQNTALKPPKSANAAGANNTTGREGAFPSFNLGAFPGGSAGSESPNRFGPYSPSSFDASDAGRGSRPTSGFFDAFNPTAGANTPGSIFPADKYSMGMVASDSHGKLGVAGAPGSVSKHARKGELDATTRLEDLQGEIFALCKDQHGCRFLQKKLEESNPVHRDMIFAETFSHFSELMTDPFGNYLCQKMLEYCTDEQRNLIVESVAPELVAISLNMHGTRAVQKMIDFLSTSRQIHSIIVALSMNVVTLIKDLNGNHVIQKCLNRLGAEDNQFIYNAVAAHCVEVATHRHGCCVLQRCIDHASESQRMQLVAEITYNALTLVQDPFGNYVVQYVLDLSNPRFTDAVVRQFVGNVCLLSVQKFSSNVMEKCIRVSEPGIRKQLIEELLNRTRLEKLLRDSFANYVVQTSLDYADPVQRMRLVECIRPILPVIRNTPYGKRIQSKLQRDNLVDLGPPSGVPPFSMMHGGPHPHGHGHGHQHGHGHGHPHPHGHGHPQQLHAMNSAMAGHPRGPAGPDYMGLNSPYIGSGGAGGGPYGPPPPAGGPQVQGQHLPPHLQQQQQQQQIFLGGGGGSPHMRAPHGGVGGGRVGAVGGGGNGGGGGYSLPPPYYGGPMP
ncbi:ARM repeat-containing protein [Testicularia cyperi]|uniref:ARM repeat-containing protein n=1 Tax=Testicularia cyperi TaxID=1882483 RepID=A0A317XJD5_9BASI|nr:ARM repeat-containing protein [Testicularia cyperi]